jgi:two-component sensor histidine kinase
VQAAKPTTLHALAQAIFAPYELESGEKRFSVDGPDLPIAGASLTSIALLLHESTTNAVKYGALSTPTGRIELKWRVEADDIVLSWRELGGPRVRTPHQVDAFGRKLAQAAITQLGGRFSQSWNPDGLRMSVVIPLCGFAS